MQLSKTIIKVIHKRNLLLIDVTCKQTILNMTDGSINQYIVSLNNG